MDDFSDPLPVGTELLNGQYKIREFLNDGGFGITYLASDSLDRSIVIKECFPRAICRRRNLEVGTRAISHREEFRSIVRAFEDEARNLSKFDHMNIVKVHQVFNENQTAYMAMDLVDGRDLLSAIQDQELDAQQVSDIAMKLLDALGSIHENNMLHRDISPDNILLDKDFNPVLIDFGAAKEEASQHGAKMTSIRVTKEGYSPQEFYVSGAKQFPSSDLYALAATLYHAISGTPPAESQARLLALAQEKPDPYVPLTGRFLEYKHGLLKAIDLAMNIAPKDRLSSASQWFDIIDESPAVSSPQITELKWIGLGVSAVLLLVSIGLFWPDSYTTTPVSVANTSNDLVYTAPSLEAISEWSSETPFTLVRNSQNQVEIDTVAPWFSKSGRNGWAKAGVILTSINDKEIVRLEDWKSLLKVEDQLKSPVKVSFVDAIGEPVKTRMVEIGKVRSAQYSSGLVLNEVARNERVSLVVSTPPQNVETDFKSGDEILAERVLGVSVSSIESFNDVLKSLESEKFRKGVFSVRRQDTVQLANLNLIGTEQ